MIRLIAGFTMLITHNLAIAGVESVSNVGRDGGASFSEPVPALGIAALVIGVVVGSLIERYIAAADLKRRGVTDITGCYLGGQVGAVIGGIAFPFIAGLLR